MMDGATWLVGTAPSHRRLQCQATGQAEACPPLQVLLTGKPCRNFQVLVAYSMLQMVRTQVLQESMTGDDILLVRAPSGPARPHRLLEAPDTHTIPGEGPWVGGPGLQRHLCPWAGIVTRLTYPEHCAACF